MSIHALHCFDGRNLAPWAFGLELLCTFADVCLGPPGTHRAAAALPSILNPHVCPEFLQEDLIEAIRSAVEEKLLSSNTKRTYAQVSTWPASCLFWHAGRSAMPCCCSRCVL